MHRLRYIVLAALLAVGARTLAADTLKVKFRSRALLDATATDYGKEDVQGYYRLEDFRVGFKATYGRYELKADIGLGGGKVAVKDLLMNYHFKNGVLSVGNGYEPFSMDMLISTADMRFNQSAASAWLSQTAASSALLFIIIHHTGILPPACTPTTTSTNWAKRKRTRSCRRRARCGATWMKAATGLCMWARRSRSGQKT